MTQSDGEAEAAAVEAELRALARRLEALGPEHPHHVHVLFAELYACTTRRWLEALEGRPEAPYAHRVIRHFMDIYRTEVLDRLGWPPGAVSPHWRTYHRLSRRLTIRSPISSHLLLISAGVRAHTHLDIGMAMRRAEADGMRHDPRLFGQTADAAFLAAALDYVALHRARQAGWRRAVLGAYRAGLILLGPVWLRVLGRWRRTGYEAALTPRAPGALAARGRGRRRAP